MHLLRFRSRGHRSGAVEEVAPSFLGHARSHGGRDARARRRDGHHLGHRGLRRGHHRDHDGSRDDRRFFRLFRGGQDEQRDEDTEREAAYREPREVTATQSIRKRNQRAPRARDRRSRRLVVLDGLVFDQTLRRVGAHDPRRRHRGKAWSQIGDARVRPAGRNIRNREQLLDPERGRQAIGELFRGLEPLLWIARCGSLPPLVQGGR